MTAATGPPSPTKTPPIRARRSGRPRAPQAHHPTRNGRGAPSPAQMQGAPANTPSEGDHYAQL